MSNRVTLEQAERMPVGELLTLPLDQIALLQEELTNLENRVKLAKALFFNVLDRRFAQRAQAARVAEGKMTGTVRLADGDITVIADVPKKITWDQPLMRAAIKVIRDDWQENPLDYVTVDIDVSETKFNGWPPMIRKVFESARTVAAGKATYKLQPKDAA